MKTKIALTLIVCATTAYAGDSRFMAPATNRAQERRQLLSDAAHAVTAAHRSASELWVYPTAESDIVFAQYAVNSKQHLEVLKLKGNQIVERRDLIHVAF
jgi:hypothetical protein